ncbi:fibronectin type III domain-containing protein [Butyrivibrio sp. WCD2001]|uniref:fibronectin type III domain-containing protein n=1 Tax=Butyrivibrio sp. WCD2001 TaxID=1280681 RepID=UPI0009DC36DB
MFYLGNVSGSHVERLPSGRLTAKKNSVTLTWKKQTKSGIKGYEIQYSTDKQFKKDVKSVTVSKAKTTSKTIKKLKTGKKYYFRIRTYICQSLYSTSKSLKKASVPISEKNPIDPCASLPCFIK